MQDFLLLQMEDIGVRRRRGRKTPYSTIDPSLESDEFLLDDTKLPTIAGPVFIILICILLKFIHMSHQQLPEMLKVADESQHPDR